MSRASTAGRPWMIGAVVASLLPALVLQATPDAPTDQVVTNDMVEAPASPLVGPWGELSLSPIVISPPLEYLQQDLVAARPPQWAFPNTTAQNVGLFLTSAGLDPAVVETLVAGARPLANAEGVMITPAPDLVRGLSPETRARIYLELGKSPLNTAQDFAFRYYGRTADDWFGGAPLSPRTRELVDPLLYRRGNFLFFADFDLIRKQITSSEELRRLHKRLLRQETFIVTLRITDPANLDRVVEYWGRGGRRTDIRPLLESIAEEGGSSSIDISHLLPTFVRQYLYRYPRTSPEDMKKPLLANCLWTALNFFNIEADDRYLDENVAIATLKRDYFFVHDNYQLGDILALSDSNGDLFHVAVYLGGGLVFGKNGASPLAPWSILPVSHLEGHYAEEQARGWRLSYLRRKDL